MGKLVLETNTDSPAQTVIMGLYACMRPSCCRLRTAGKKRIVNLLLVLFGFRQSFESAGSLVPSVDFAITC